MNTYPQTPEFEIGQKVISPEGEGVIESIKGKNITVKLSSGKIVTVEKSNLTDDSDAG